MPYVFINYRVDDSQDAARSLRDALTRAFGDDSVFMDTSGLTAGDQWPTAIESALARATCLIAVVGTTWLTQVDEWGRRRIDDEADWVRREIETALTTNVPVVPVLIREARLPPPHGLPTGPLRDLPSQESFRLGRKTWERDVAALIDVLSNKYGFDLLLDVDGSLPVGSASARDRHAVSPAGLDLTTYAERCRKRWRYVDLSALADPGALDDAVRPELL